jgi:hypothetical protein
MARGKSIEQRAKRAGAKGKRIGTAKQALRDTLIVARKAQDWPIESIAAEAGIGVRAVHRVLSEREAVGEALLDRDPIDVVKQIANLGRKVTVVGASLRGSTSRARVDFSTFDRSVVFIAVDGLYIAGASRRLRPLSAARRKFRRVEGTRSGLTNVMAWDEWQQASGSRPECVPSSSGGQRV